MPTLPLEPVLELELLELLLDDEDDEALELVSLDDDEADDDVPEDPELVLALEDPELVLAPALEDPELAAL